MHARIARLSAHARFLAEAQALAFDGTFTDQTYRALLPTVSSTEIELALSELLTARALVRDGEMYMLAHRVWVAAFRAELDVEQTKRHHRALARMYAAQATMGFVHHAFLCDLDRQALQAMDARNERYRSEADYMTLVEQGVGKLIWCYPRAIATARVLGRSAHDVHDLRRWQYLGVS
jgi:hypothetical protein